VVPQCTRQNLVHMDHRKNRSFLIGYYDPGGDVFRSKDDPLGEHFPGGEHCLAACGLYVGEFSAFRIGIEFINVEEISRQRGSIRKSIYSTYSFAIGCSVR
jgi:hypothetical protein